MSDYFQQLQTALREADVTKPTLVIDRERLHHNIKVMLDFLPSGMGYRIVAKSMPCEALIREVRHATGTDRLMVFNLDYLELLASRMPECDMLLGKPLPARAVKQFLSRHHAQRNELKIQWLADSLTRVKEYQAVAAPGAAAPEATATAVLRINLELDVGLHRGGFETIEALEPALAFIRQSKNLTLAGFMGYEPHLASLPEKDGWRERATQGAWAFYRAAVEAAGAAGFDKATLLCNGAGSPTYRLYADSALVNEVSVGSVLLKPTDFDTPLLEPHIAASFIATPVLKRIKGLKVPGAAYSNRALPYELPAHTDRAFIYGGKWMAKVVYPPGAKVSEAFGKSSNQEMLEVPQACALAVDDFAFFRPTQSEAIFTYLGALAIYQGGKIVDFWEPFPSKP